MDRVTKLVDQLTNEEICQLKKYLAQITLKPAVRAEIPCKFPSLNEYVRACRGNRYMAANYKKQIQSSIGWSLNSLPVFNKPVFIDFTWVEGNNKRDWDNVTYSKKFILDTLVALGKLSDDGRKYVKGFRDKCEYKKGEWKVILEIREIDEEWDA